LKSFKVRYEYDRNGNPRSRVRTTGVIKARAGTESAIKAELRRRNPRFENIVVLEIKPMNRSIEAEIVSLGTLAYSSELTTKFLVAKVFW